MCIKKPQALSCLLRQTILIWGQKRTILVSFLNFPYPHPYSNYSMIRNAFWTRRLLLSLHLLIMFLFSYTQLWSGFWLWKLQICLDFKLKVLTFISMGNFNSFPSNFSIWNLSPSVLTNTPQKLTQVFLKSFKNPLILNFYHFSS